MAFASFDELYGTPMCVWALLAVLITLLQKSEWSTKQKGIAHLDSAIKSWFEDFFGLTFDKLTLKPAILCWNYYWNRLATGIKDHDQCIATCQAAPLEKLSFLNWGAEPWEKMLMIEVVRRGKVVQHDTQEQQRRIKSVMPVCTPYFTGGFMLLNISLQLFVHFL